MRFTSYLLEYEREYETSRRTPLEVAEAVSWAQKHAPKVLEAYRKSEAVRIYRGTGASLIAYLVDPQKSIERVSANTTNFYTLFINYDSAYAAFPKRSIICTTDMYYTYHGARYVVIPKDGAKIGVCPEHDIWGTITGYGSLDTINNDIAALADIVGKYEDAITLKTLGEMKALFKLYDKSKSNLEKEYEENSMYFPKLVHDYINSPSSFYEFYAKIMNPKKLKFKVVEAGYNFAGGGEREVWLDSECLLYEIDGLGNFNLTFDKVFFGSEL